MKTKILYLFIMIFAVFALPKIGYSQISFYSFSETTGNTFSSISATGTSVTLGDDNSSLQSIGFTFDYNSTSYTQLHVGSNGWLRLGTGSAGGAANTNLTSTSSSYQETIAPFWDDLNPSGVGDVYIETQGSSPNRTFIVEYDGVQRYGASNSGVTITVQAVFYEGSNNIEFRYGSSAGTFSSATIGINESPGGSSHYISVTPSSPATSSTSSANNSITAAPADGVNYLFTYTPPSCPAPTDQTVTSVTATTAQLNWTSGGATTYGVEYGPAGFTQGTGTYVAVATDEFLAITGLTSGTSYDWYVKDSCSATDVSTWVGANRFTTTYSPNYAEDFSTYTPTDWTEAKGFLSQNAVLTGTTSNWTSDGFANDGSSGSARMEIWSTGKKEWLISPSIDLSGGNNHFLAFDVALTAFSNATASTFGADDTLAVVISTDNGATWSLANALQIWDAGSEPSNTGDHIIINLPAATYSSTVKIGFYAASSVSGGDINVYIDNFEVNVLTLDEVEVSEVLGSYGSIEQGDFTVNAIVKNNGSNAQANITLNYLLEGGSVVSQSGFALAAYTTDTFSFTTQLSGSATADSLMLSVYSTLSGDENPSNDIAYTEVITWGIPYNIGFEAETSLDMPSSWSLIKTYSLAYAYAYESSSAFEGTKSLRMYNGNTTSDTLIAILPSYEGALLTDKWFSFQGKASTNGSTVIIGVMTDPADATTFEAIETKTLNTSYAEYIVKLDTYTGSGKYLAFKHGANATYRSLYIDNVSLFIPPQNDAAITAFNPITLSGSHDVIVDLKNAGALTISSVNIYYSIDGGTAVGPFAWTGTLAQAATITGLNIGTHNFDQTDIEIEVWTNLPNGMQDENTSNDTLKATIDITIDAGIYSMDETTIKYGESSINAFIANFGSDNLTTSDVAWSINDVLQTPGSWSGNVLSGEAAGPINLGTFNFDVDTHYVKIWSEAPNGAIDDDNNDNDTLKKTFIFNIDAGISQIDVPTEIGTQDVIVYIENFNNVPLISATIKYTINSDAEETFDWTGNILPDSVGGPFIIGDGTFLIGNDTIIAYTMDPNSGSDIDADNDTLKKYFVISTDLALIDGGVTSTSNCGRGNDTVFIEIQNNSTAAVTGPFDVSYKEGTSTTVSEVFPSTETIQPGASLIYKFTTLINLAVSTDGSFDVEAWVDFTNDGNTDNDTIKGEINSWLTPTDPTTTGATVAFGNPAVLNATLTQGNQLNWYESETSDVLLENGTTYTTPNLYDNTTYYVSAEQNVTQAGDYNMAKDNGTSSSNIPLLGYYYKYMWSRYVYTPADFGITSDAIINSLSFQLGSSITNKVMTNQKIYLMRTSDSDISSTSYIDPAAAGAKLVFDGTYTFDGSNGDWVEFNLLDTFHLNADENLILFYENHMGSYGYPYVYFKYNYTSNSMVYKRSDSGFPSTSTGAISYYLPNLKLDITMDLTTSHCKSDPIPVVANVTGIPSDAGITNIDIVTETGSQDVIVELTNFSSIELTSVAIDFEVNDVAGTTFSWTGSLAKDSTEIVNIGTGTFVYGVDTIKAWSSNPNTSTDPNAINDTLEIGFTIFADIAVIGIQSLSGCNLTTDNVVAQITNFGDDTIHSYDMAYHVIGEASAVTETVTVAIAPEDTITYTFSTAVDLSTSMDSTFQIWVYTHYSPDSTTTNDSMLVSAGSNLAPTDLVAYNDTVAYGTSATLRATSAYNFAWYDDAIGGNMLANTDTFITPNLYDTTSYFVEAINGQAVVRITEIVQYMTAVGKTDPYPSYILHSDYDGMEITNLGYGNADLSGYTINFEGYFTGSWTFPSGSILASGELLIIDYRTAAGSTDLSNNYYCLGKSWSPQSNSAVAYYLSNASGDIIDAVATNGATFSAASGVTASHWSGNIASSSSKAGVSRYTADNNVASDWKIASVDFPSQTIGAMNPTLSLLAIGCTSSRIEAIAVVNSFPAKDAGIVSINTPNDGINLTSAELINITIKNNGTVAIDTLPVHYMLDAATAVVDTLFATIMPGDTANFTFASTIDLSAVAVYSLEVTTALMGDVITNNDAVTKSIQQGDYCISKATYTSHNDIGNVTISHIITNVELLNNGFAVPVVNNTIANKTYSDFTALAPIDAEIGQAYLISISQIQLGSTISTSAIKVYIDANQDGDFDDAFEMVANGNTVYPSGNIVIDTMIIPQNALLGNTRMRIVLDRSDVANACGTYTYGETEDYTINIVEQVFAEAGANDTVCYTFGTTLVGSGQGTGLSYAWSTGDNATMTTVTPTTTTMYYFSVTDTYGFTATDSAEVFVRDLPLLTFPALSDMCVDANAITLTATPAGGTYSGAGVTGNIFNPTTAGAGTHTLKYIYTNMYGCTDSITTTQFVNELPNITATSAATNNTVPYNSSTTLDATVANAIGALSYYWSPTASINGDTAIQMPTTVDILFATSFVVEITDASTACKNTDTVNITYSGGPVTVNPISVPTSICAGDTALLKAQSAGGTGTITYIWTSNPIGFSSTDENPQAMPTQNTWYIVEATDGTNSSIDSTYITILADPTIIYSMDTTFVCIGSQGDAIVNLTGLAPFSYTYNGIMTNATSNIDTVITVALNADATYFVTSITDANGCSSNGDLDSLQFIINDLPTVIYTGSDTICIGGNTIATATFTGAIPFDYIYNGITVSGVNAMSDDQTIAPTMDSMYTVTSITDGNGCISTGLLDSITVLVNQLATATVSDNDTLCIGDSVQLAINFVGASPYTFSVTDGTTPMSLTSATDAFNKYVDPTAATTYTLTTITDANGCIANNLTEATEIFVNSLPAEPTFTGLGIDYCEDAAVITLSGLPTGGLFSGAGITGNDFDPSTAVSGNNDIEYRIADVNGCENFVIHSTVINVLPTIVISGLASDYCIDAADVTLIATPSGASGVWSGAATTTGDFSPATSGLGTHTVYYEFTDGNSCVNSDSVSTIVNALPVVVLTTLADVCADANNFMISGATPVGGDWSGNGVSSNYFNATNAGTGPHYLTYTFTDANGCVDFDSTTQLVNALPVLNVTGLDAAYCANAVTDTLSATPIGGSFFGAGMTANVFDPSIPNTGSVSILYMYTDGTTGCFNSIPTVTIVNAIPVIDLGTDNTVCENNTSTLDAENAGATYLWSTGATTQTIVIDTNGFGIGDFMYNVLVTDANMCANMDSVEITYEALPVSQLTDTNTICGEDSYITLEAGYVSGNTYVWSNGVSWSSITINSTDLGGNTGNMSVVITSNAGCITNDATYVYFREVPVVDLGGDQIACVNHEFTLDAGAGFTSYLWNTGATTQSITIDNNTFDVGQNMLKVEVYNDVNCNAMDSMMLVVDPCTGVEMPELANANINIYPNPTKGQFQIDVVGLENEEYNLDIYNSVGAVVYSDKVSNDGNNKQTWKLDFSTYAKGVYYIRLHSNGDIKVKRIVIN